MCYGKQEYLLTYCFAMLLTCYSFAWQYVITDELTIYFKSFNIK